MRADRAYIASLGTTGVLVASAVLLLAVVSALVAFRGWPGTGFAEDIGHLVVGEPERTLPVGGPRQAARNAAPAAAAVARRPAPGTAAAARASAARTAPVRTRPVTPTPPTPPGPQGERDFRARPPGRRQIPPPPAPPPRRRTPVLVLPDAPVTAEVERLTNGLGDTTQGLTDDLGRTVGGVSPQLGVTLTDTGRLLAELLRSLVQMRR